MSRELTHPALGLPVDTAGKPATTEPIEGGVAIVNASVPPGHDAHVVYRELTSEERGQRKRDWKLAAEHRASQARAFLRLERNRRLADTDWTQQPDAPLTAKQLAAYVAYRRQLRDLPARTADPENPVWPEPPAQ